VVLQVGFLDVLFCICQNHDFTSSKILKSGHGTFSTNSKHLLIAANTALLDITGYLEYRSLVLNHPISGIWPRHQLTSHIDPFATTAGDILLDTDKDVTFDDDSLYITLSM
jgi:hypothetical protein